MSTLLVFICWARRRAYLGSSMLAKSTQLLTTTLSMYTMCRQIHYLFGQPQWQRLEVNRCSQAAIVRGRASIKNANVVRKISSVILTAPTKINELCHCSSLCLRYMYFSSIHYWTCKLFVYWNLLPTKTRTRCGNIKTATTRISHYGISPHARTRCGCYKPATTRNFVSWLFWYCHNAFWIFFPLIERFPSLSVTFPL
jgi:hypothetical protein